MDYYVGVRIRLLFHGPTKKSVPEILRDDRRLSADDSAIVEIKSLRYTMFHRSIVTHA
jgi:hypothetical protein